jgi:hypothetical protein
MTICSSEDRKNGILNKEMRRILFLIVCLISNALSAQDMSFSKTGNSFYHELPDPAVTRTSEWSALRNDINVSFASDNIRYAKKTPPSVPAQESWKATAWKGEMVHTQILVWTKKVIPDLSFKVDNLINEKGDRIESKNVTLGFVRYVMTDEFGRGCDHRKPSDYDSSLVEDPIDIITVIPVQANTVQPIWLSVKVPESTPAGKYTGAIIINAEKQYKLKIVLNVLNHVLPPPDKWKFDLDLWQSANSIAKVHDVELWSNKHFEIMRPYFKMLAAAGQKTITANIISQPWGKTHIYYEDPSLIRWIKKTDGSWFYDYGVFDRYIAFMMDCGIDKHINCYTMVTWDLSFIYFDEATGKETSLQIKPGSPEYIEYWSAMLIDFTKHLKDKGWFNLTAIAMDERPMESMKEVITLLKKIDPLWKIALAGGYHPEIEKDIYDYCLYISDTFSETELRDRKAHGKPATFYTACDDEHPNGHSFSPPAENAWISWYAASAGFTGYLRWAYNNWAKAPLLDTRFRTWPAGENYQIYPGPRTSIRFEKLIEGIQDFEKIRILREQFIKEGRENDIKALNDIVSAFKIEKLKVMTAAEMVTHAQEQLNKF